MPTTLNAAVTSFLHDRNHARGTQAEYFTTLKKWTQWGGGVAVEVVVLPLAMDHFVTVTAPHSVLFKKLRSQTDFLDNATRHNKVRGG